MKAGSSMDTSTGPQGKTFRYHIDFQLISLSRGIHPDGELNYIGLYNAGLPIGMTWVSVKGGGWIVGCVDSQGNLSGEVMT